MKISVVTINLNNASGLNRTIESVVNQLFHNYEYIVIDGGSTDGSVDIIRSFSDRFSYWVSEPDNGVYHAMNKGLRKANGEYVLFLNSGDLLYDLNVLTHVFEIERTAEILYGSIWIEDEKRLINYPQHLSMAFLYEQTIIQQSTFYKRSIFEQACFDESYRLISDWAFLINNIVFRNCTYQYLNQIIAIYDSKGISSGETSVDLICLEKKHFLNASFPKLVLDDFQEQFQFRKSELYESVIFLQKTVGLRKLVANLVRIIIYVYRSFRKNI